MGAPYILVIIISITTDHFAQAVLQKGPPVITTPVQPRFIGRLGEAIRFICPIRADPAPIFEWYRDGERVMQYWDRYRFLGNGYSLHIQRLECEDQGIYVCKAINGFGVHEISFQLDLLNESLQEACKSSSDEDDISSKPIILDKPKKSKHMLKPAGNYALLRCTATGEPLPTFTWLKDRVEIASEKNQIGSAIPPKYVIRSTVLSEEDLAGENEGLRSTLQISDLRGSDTANYTCRANNDHGWDELTQVLEVIERQVPRRPELHQEFPPQNSWTEVGQAGSLSCKVLSEFPPEIHWLKKMPASELLNSDLSALPDEDEVESFHPQFVANRTLTIGNSKYQILPSAPPKLGNDGYYLSILLLSKKSQEIDSGFYICLALNNAGYNFRQVYFNVTGNSLEHSQPSDDTLGTRNSENWNERGRAEATTTAVVVVVVICGIAGMIASCFVWKRRKNHLKDKAKGLPAPAQPPAQQPVVVEQPPLALALSLPNYNEFREGISSSNIGAYEIPGSARSESAQVPSIKQLYAQQSSDHVEHRVYYLPPRASITNSPLSQKLNHQQRSKASLCSAGGRSGSGSRHYKHYYRPSPHKMNNLTNFNYSLCHHSQQSLPPEARSLTADTSFHSDSFYPDWAAHHHHIRLPYPSPETSFEQP